LVLVDPNADLLVELLAADVASDRLAHLVEIAKVRFGGGVEEQADMEGKIRSAVIQAQLPKT
jgi:hypothetical protein